MIFSTSTGERDASSMPGIARIASPWTVCVQAELNNAAMDHSTKSLGAVGMASPSTDRD
jgi:hypothetical protein